MGKIGHFLGKIQGQFSQHGKTKDKSQNINKKPIKRPYSAASFSPHFPRKTKVFGKKSGLSWEKSRHYWEKSHVSWENGNLVNNMVNAPTRPEGAEAPSPGHSPWVNQQSTLRPVRAKALKIRPQPTF